MQVCVTLGCNDILLQIGRLLCEVHARINAIDVAAHMKLDGYVVSVCLTGSD